MSVFSNWSTHGKLVTMMLRSMHSREAHVWQDNGTTLLVNKVEDDQFKYVCCLHSSKSCLCWEKGKHHIILVHLAVMWLLFAAAYMENQLVCSDAASFCSRIFGKLIGLDRDWDCVAPIYCATLLAGRGFLSQYYLFLNSPRDMEI